MRNMVDDVEFHQDCADEEGVPANAHVPIGIFNAWAMARGFWQLDDNIALEWFEKWKHGEVTLFDFVCGSADFKINLDQLLREVRLFAFQYGTSTDFYNDIKEFFGCASEYHAPDKYSALTPFFVKMSERYLEHSELE